MSIIDEGKENSKELEKEEKYDDSIKGSMPIGLGFSLAANKAAMENYSRMSSEERAIFEEKSRHAKSKADMEVIADGIASFRILNNNR